MLSIANKLYQMLTPYERRRAALLMVMILCMGILDMIGVASIVPFMSVLAQPLIVESNPYLNLAYHYSQIQNPKDFLFLLGLVVLALLILSIAFKALTTFAILRFTRSREFNLSSRLIGAYLNQPYEWFLNHHSADLGKTILNEVAQVVGQAMLPLANMIAAGTSALCLILLLLYVDPLLAVVVISSLTFAYLGIYLLLRPIVTRVGKERWENNRLRFQVVSEAFGGIKEIKLAGLESIFCDRFRTPARKNANALAVSSLAGQLPKFALEAIAFGGMLTLALYLMRFNDSLEESIPLLALYALAGYRILPMLQQVYHSATVMRFSAEAVENLHRDCKIRAASDKRELDSSTVRLKVSRELCLQGISYRYPNTEKDTISNLTLSIPAFTTVGLVGTTGSGKTTTVDIILGLLQPSSGCVLVDGEKITPGKLRSWQRCLGYVPQQIYLSDDTIASNIAFGIKKSDIDFDAVERVSKIANLHAFVSGELADGYDTIIGERGVRLSGGQRQRIGIARALYHSPQVLILDEATSALDNLTEKAVMEAVSNLASRLTLILVAHRLTTVRNCEQIFMLDHGALAGCGTYDELMAVNEPFRQLARANMVSS